VISPSKTCHPERSEGSAVRRQHRRSSSPSNREQWLRLHWFTIAFSLLMLLVPLASLSEIVQVVKNTVGRNAVITVTKNGQPLVGVDVFIDEPQYARTKSSPSHIAKGITDSNGDVSMSGLPVGSYAVFVGVDDKRHWLGSLEVSAEIASARSHATYDMFPKFPPPCGHSHEPLQARVQQLRGSVVDLTDAVIPNVVVEIYEGRTPEGAPLVRLKTDKIGRFASELGHGDYIMVLSAPGFVRQEVAVAIGPEGWHGMRVTVAIGGSDCGNARPGDEPKVTEEN